MISKIEHSKALKVIYCHIKVGIVSRRLSVLVLSQGRERGAQAGKIYPSIGW
jgi:hypothetical protein